MIRRSHRLEVTVSGQDLHNVNENLFDKAQLVREAVMDAMLLKPNVRAVNTIQGPGPKKRSMFTKFMNHVKNLICDKACLRQFGEVRKPLNCLIKSLQVLLWIRMRLIEHWKPVVNKVQNGHGLCAANQAWIGHVEVPVQ